MKITFKRNSDKILRLQLENAFEKAKMDLELLSLITNAIMQSLEPDQVLYTILTALTSHEGLGFNRAIFFELDEKDMVLRGRMGLGPCTLAEANEIWDFIMGEKMTLQNLIDKYEAFKKSPETDLNRIIRDISVPVEEDGCILAMTVLEGLPFEVVTDKAKSRLDARIREKLRLCNFVTVPLKTKNRTLGTLLVDNLFSNTPITRDCIRILTIFADHAAMAIENSFLYDKTVHMSRMDWLTGLWNARHFNDSMDEKVKTSLETGSELSLLMIDIDNFKGLNDSFGHFEGDNAIKKVADILRTNSRREDLVARYGGEEFCIMMPGTPKKEALKTAERLRKEVEKIFFKNESSPKTHRLTISQGLATLPSDDISKEGLIKKADLALYHSKSTGKNGTTAYSRKMEKTA